MKNYDIFRVMRASLILKCSMEIPNYIGILPLPTAHSSLSGTRVEHSFQPQEGLESHFNDTKVRHAFRNHQHL